MGKKTNNPNQGSVNDIWHCLKDAQALARHTAFDLGLAEEGQSILVVQGFSSDPELNTPSVTVVTV